MKKLFKLMLGVMVIVAFNSCVSGSSSNSSNSSNQESYWVGRVKPGTYSGSYHDENGARQFGTPELDYTYTLTIEEDRSIVLREQCRNCYNGSTTTKVFRGYISKYVETYNGEKKVWYGIEGEGSGWATYHNLSTSLVLTAGNCRTYQEYSGNMNWHACRLN